MEGRTLVPERRTLGADALRSSTERAEAAEGLNVSLSTARGWLELRARELDGAYSEDISTHFSAVLGTVSANSSKMTLGSERVSCKRAAGVGGELTCLQADLLQRCHGTHED